MGPYSSLLNYCILMDSEGGTVTIFSCGPKGEPTRLHWTVLPFGHTDILVKVSAHKTKGHECGTGTCKEEKAEIRE